MSAEPSGLTLAETAHLTRRAALLSVSMAVVLVSLKAAAWIASGSIALLASLADSGLDLIASTLTLVAVTYAASSPDATHRYGHGKAEAFASLMQGGLVFASAALIGREAIHNLMAPHVLRAEGWAIGVMAVSTALTAGLVTIQTRIVRRTASVAVSGDRAHYASDLASNLVALAGIAAAAVFGVTGLDAAAGLIVAAILLWGAVGVFRQASKQLLDHELSDRTRAKIVELMTQDPRVTHVHQLRTRAAGPVVHVQMHIDLDPNLSLDAAHKVIVDAENRVLSEFPSADILIHPDPRGRAEPHGGAFAEQPPAA